MEETETVTIDKQGRLVLPSRIRKALGLGGGDDLTVRLENSQIILEPKTCRSLEETVTEWVEAALNLKVEAFAEKPEDGWKWMSSEYARRKLGLF